MYEIFFADSWNLFAISSFFCIFLQFWAGFRSVFGVTASLFIRAFCPFLEIIKPRKKSGKNVLKMLEKGQNMFNFFGKRQKTLNLKTENVEFEKRQKITDFFSKEKVFKVRVLI